ncbi:PKD domain-containing protein [Aureispira sp. CCB-E]|uniref:PKD domain-containing protein n=1 Tax=Aureispira sp. CCB-E TaxID=3051121 RepID=UPI0028692952|nr:PKD domain-containing protein [Aureispira sp. CCB-E]WMX15304.1 PKD domain-containing protein [Aureispira sp. CCB-E]
MTPRILFLIIFFCYNTITFAQITTDFNANFIEICAPDVVQFTDNSTSTNTIIQWEWKSNGITFSNLQNPSLFFNTPGSYDICLITTDNLGNIDSLCQNNYITAYNSPTANFSTDVTTGCDPLIVNFTDLSSLGDAPIQSWRWDFGDGNIDTVHQHPTHTYTTIGNFDVTLIVVDTNGCSSSILNSNLITVSTAVTANITHNAYQPQCGLPASVNLYGSSAGTNLTYTWYLGDNNTATGQNISHSYLSAGCFSPTLVVNNGFCTATATVTSCITVTDNPTAAFTIADTAGCHIPFNINISNQSTGLTSYSWNFGDGGTSSSFNPSHTYTSYAPQDTMNYPLGVFPVVLEVSNAAGCMDSDTQFVYISNLNTIINPNNLPCAPDTAYYSVNSLNISPAFSSVNWIWTLDNMVSTIGSSAAAYYPDSGIYHAQVIVTDNIGCIDTANRTVEIGMIPTIDSITTDTNQVCRITSINFDGYGSSFIDFWNWTFTDNSIGIGSSFSHIFQDTGAITGSLTASFRGCLATVPLDTYYIFPPISKFSYNLICDSLDVDFIDESVGAHRWYWDFGDTTTLADTSTIPSPSYTYPDTGVFIVLLIVYNDSTGCVDSFRNVIQIARPVANFDFPDSICTIGNLQPTNLSQSADAYLWTAFGSVPFSVNATEPLLEYRQPGVFPIMLTAFAANGCFDTLRQYIHVAGIDTNIVHTLPACRPAVVTFSDSSIGILSPIVGWQWSNGSTQQSAIAQYSFPGTEAMNVQVTNDWGCTFDLVDSIDVGGAFINFSTARDICLGNQMTAVALTGSPANANAFRPFTYIWDFGDGTIDTTFSTVNYHTYTSAGLYDVCLNVVDMLGCVTTLCRTDWVEVHDPAPQFTADTFFSSCPPLEVNFSNLSSSGGQWSWDFGDGSVSNLENPTHVYSISGFYDVILEVTAFPGCSQIDTIRQMIQITGPTGNFIMPPQNSCSPYTAEFIGSGTNVATYTWLFGNGDIQSNNTNSNTDTTYYTYTQAGTYVPILVVDDGAGCQIPIEQDTIFITAPPAPNFSADTLICQFDSIQYHVTTAITNNTSIEWLFEGGLPNASSLTNPVIYYPDTGSFEVRLILTKDGCADTLVRANYIEIKAAPIANFGVTMADSCVPVLTQFTDSSTSSQGYILDWSWDFGNNQTANSQDTALVYNQANTFPVQLVVENNFGCKDSLLQTLTTYPSPNVDAGSYPTICGGDSIQLQGTASGNFLWSSSAWISDSSIANPITTIDSTQNYILISTNSFGCSHTDTTTIVVTPNTTVDAGINTSICLGDSVLLQASGNTNMYDWGNSPSLSCQYCATPLAFPDTTTTYYLQPNGNPACANIDSIIVQVNPLPIGQIIGDTLLCTGDTLQLTALGGQTYTWLTGLALSDSSIANPFALPTMPSTYTVVVRDSNNCQDSLDLFVNISNIITPPLPDQTICLGDSVTLNLTNAHNPTWFGDSLSCYNCLQTSAYPIDSNRYVVHYYNHDNCLVKDSLYVYVLDLRQLEALGSDSICLGDTVLLTVLGNQNAPVEWIPNYALSDPNSTTPLTYPSVDTQYIVQVQQGHCYASDTLQIHLHPRIEIQTNDLSYCTGDSAQLITTGNSNSFKWTPSLFLSNDSIANPVVTVPYNQTYQVVGMGRCNTDTAYADIQVYDYPALQLDSSTTAILGSTLVLDLTTNSGSVINWSPSIDLSCNNCPNPSWVVRQKQTFYVTVSNQLGCIVLDSITVYPISDCTSDLVFVPNAFTPDADGHNDILYAQSGIVQEIESFQIYSRWGELLFETNDLAQGWDGTVKGQVVAPDVFGYFLIFRCPNTGEKMLKKGNVTILR